MRETQDDVLRELSPDLLSLNFSLNQFTNLAGLRMAAQSLFGENQLSIDDHLEYSALGRGQLQRGDLWFKVFQQVSRETHSSRRIISNGAIFNTDSEHGQPPDPSNRGC